MAFYNSIQEQIKSGDGITLTVDDNSGSVIISAVGGGGAVPISGTTDRISVEGSVSQTVDIASTYIGQTTIHTLGNISIGTWNAGDVTANNVTATNLNITANNNVITLSALSTLSASINFTLPSTIGAINQSLVLSDNNGTMGWKTQSLSALSDCSTSGVTNDQVLVYNLSSSAWTPYTFNGVTFSDTNKTISVAATTALSGLTVDTLITSAADKQLLAFVGGSTLKWENTTIGLSSRHLSDVAINGAANNQVLQFNGTSWVNNTNLQLSGNLVLVNGSYNITLQTPSLSASSLYVLPSTIGSTGQVLTVSSAVSGVNSLSWTTPSSGGGGGSSTATGLQSLTTTVSVSGANAPGANQALMATSSTAATWQTVNHLNLSHVGTNTHAQIDSFVTNYNSKSAGLYTFPSTVGTTGQILTASDNAGTLGWNTPVPSNLRICSLMFLNITSFTGSPLNYNISSNYDCYVVDSDNLPSDYNTLNLPYLSGNGSQIIYIQVVGNSQFTLLSIGFNSLENNLFYANNSATSSYGIYNNSTYKLTYYATAGNPWQGTYGPLQQPYPCWTLEQLPSNVIPLKSNVDLYAFQTNAYRSIVGNFSLPSSFASGQCFRIKDMGGAMGTAKLSITSTSPYLINGSSSAQTFSTNNYSGLFCNVSNNLINL